MGGAIICAETTANFKISREWQTPATLKLPILNLRKRPGSQSLRPGQPLALDRDCTSKLERKRGPGVTSSALHVLISRALSESISNVNLSFCTVRNIFDRLLPVERVGCRITAWPGPGKPPRPDISAASPQRGGTARGAACPRAGEAEATVTQAQ